MLCNIFDEYLYNISNINNDLGIGSVFSDSFTNTYTNCDISQSMSIPFIGGEFHIGVVLKNVKQ